MTPAGGGGSERPWYRQAWPWALMLPPALAVLGGGLMLALATRAPVALVVADYARIEAETADRFGRDREAVRLGVEAEIVFAAGSSGPIEARLSGGPGFAPPSRLVLSLRHATDPAADRSIPLERRGELFVAAASLTPGRYHLELGPEDAAWRLAADVVRLDRPIALRAQSGGD